MTYRTCSATGQVSALTTDGEFIALKRYGDNKLTVYSIFAPNSVPLTINSPHVASCGRHLLLLKTSSSPWSTDSSSADDGNMPHVFAPSSHGIVIFNLLLAFGSAGADSSTGLGSPPTIVNLHPTTGPIYQCQRLVASEDGSVIACAHRTGVSVLALRKLKVLEVPQAAVTAIAVCTESVPGTAGASHQLARSSSPRTAIATSSNCVSLWWTDPSSKSGSATRLGTSTQLSGFEVSELVFHPCQELLLAATMDGTIHLLSTATSSPCVSTGALSLSTLCSSSLQAACVLYPPPGGGCSKLTEDHVAMHAEAIRTAEQGSATAAARMASPSSAEVTAWCSTVQWVQSMRFVQIPDVATQSNSDRTPRDSQSGGDIEVSSACSILPDVWRLVIMASNAVLILNPAGMLLLELNLLGASAATLTAFNHVTANCNVRVTGACGFMAGTCAIAPTYVRSCCPSVQPSEKQSSRQKSSSKSGARSASVLRTCEDEKEGSRAFQGCSMKLCLPTSDCKPHTDSKWDHLDARFSRTEVSAAGHANESEPRSVYGIVCAVASEFNGNAEALWLQGSADLEKWIPKDVLKRTGRSSLSNLKGKCSSKTGKGCVLKAAVTETGEKTKYRQRLDVFNTSCKTTKSLLSRSPYQVSGKSASQKDKKPPPGHNSTASGPGRLSSRRSSTHQGITNIPSSYKRQGINSKEPVTFHRKIVSSGYGLSAVFQCGFKPDASAGMTYPKQQLGKLPPKPRKSETDPGARQAALHAANMQSTLGTRSEELVHMWSPHTRCEHGSKVQVGSSPVTSLATSLDGAFALVGCSNGELTTLPSALSGPRQVSACGHSSGVPVQSTHFSHSGKHMLSSCQDGVVCVWTCQATDPAVTITPGLKDGAKQPAFAAFAGMDRWILVGVGSCLKLFWWNVPDSIQHNDVDRMKQKATIDIGFSMPVPTGLRVSSLATQNGLFSHIALISASDCALHAVDIGAGSPIATVSSAHDRPIERLEFVPASPFVSASTAAEACNTVLASSKGGCVRLWDIRSMSPIRQFSPLQNSSRKAAGVNAAAVSPCGRIAACGAADPAEIYIYETRMAGVLQVLRQDGAAVPSALQFVQGQPILLTGSQGGQVCSFLAR